jgi:uncharacterized Zn finger protein
MGYYDSQWPRYVSAAERRRRAASKLAKLKKSGRTISPIAIAGRKIATTFWGEAWCTNLEAYSDYDNRLPRGRSYVRNGSVLDLRIKAGSVCALVSGSDLYEIDIRIKPLPTKQWAAIKGRCAGQIDSLVELLRGSISGRVMEVVTQKGAGLFPSPAEIAFECSCPDWASMCTHVAATLYGVGARLDCEPELLFTLRKTDPTELVEAAVGQPSVAATPRKGRLIAARDLSSVFGIDIDAGGLPSGAPSTPRTRATKKKGTARSGAKNKAGRSKAPAKKATAKRSTPVRRTKAGQRTT